MSEPLTVMACYRVRPGAEAAFESLLGRHARTLRELDLVSAEPRRVYRGTEVGGALVYHEVFEWRDERAAKRAHSEAAVQEVWNAMSELLEARGGRPQWEFPHVERLEPR